MCREESILITHQTRQKEVLSTKENTRKNFRRRDDKDLPDVCYIHLIIQAYKIGLNLLWLAWQVTVYTLIAGLAACKGPDNSTSQECNPLIFHIKQVIRSTSNQLIQIWFKLQLITDQDWKQIKQAMILPYICTLYMHIADTHTVYLSLK